MFHLHKVFNGRVIICQIGGGKCGENFPVHDPLIYQLCYTGDFSKPMVALFRERLRKYYKGDIGNLRRAWSKTDVTFENAMPPDRVERMSQEWFSLRSPFRRQTADYYKVLSECIEDCAIGWCKAVKEATNNESLTITPMASVLDVGLNSFFIRQLSKNSYSKCAASPYVDMLQAPASYAYRDPGRGDCSPMVPMGSLNLAGKIWYRDFDSRTSVVKAQAEAHPVGSLWITPATPWQDIQILKRDAACSLIDGGSWRWHEINEGMYKLPEHTDTAKCIYAVARGIVHANRARVPGGLGVFIDTNSNFHMANSNRVIFPMNYESRLLHWRHAGMSCDIYDLPDVENPRILAHKVIMVTNAFCMTKDQGKSIIEMAKRNNAIVIWLMAPGVHTPMGFNLEQSSRITGFKICSADIQALPRITMIPNEDPITRLQMPNGSRFTSFGCGPHDYDDGGARGVGPIFYVDTSRDPNTVVLGMLDALHKPGLVYKEMEGYISVYCAAPYIPNVLLRAIGNKAGAHLYLDTDDLVHVCDNLIMVHANSKGVKEICWHGEAQSVIDLFSGQEIAKNSSKWSIEMELYETRLFFAGTAAAGQKVVDNIQS